MKNHIAMKKAQEQRAFEQECSLNSYLTGQQRLQNFLSDGTQGSADMMNFQSTAMGALAAMDMKTISARSLRVRWEVRKRQDRKNFWKNILKGNAAALKIDFRVGEKKQLT